MKSKAKLTLTVLFTLGISFTFSIVINNNLHISLGNTNNQCLNTSKTSEKIHIIGNSGWIDFKDAGKCTGNGTYLNPYVIKDLEIDGGGSGSCILIENSDVFFIIENCTVCYSGSNWDDAGIELVYVENSLLINNTCFNNENGIYLRYSNYTSILGNNVTNNYEGIFLYDTSFNNVSRNYLNTNGYGINLGACYNCIVSGNSASNSYIGIDVIGGINNKISANTAKKNERAGIYLSYSYYNNISENSIYKNRYGIELFESDDNTISGNVVYNNTYGIQLSIAHLFWAIIGYNYRNNISGNIASNNRIGVILKGCYWTTVSGNIMNDCGLKIYGSLEELSSHDIDNTNLVNGKPLYYYSDKKNLGPSNFTNAGQVILVNCNDSVISNVDASNGSIGIYLYHCDYNTVVGNNASHNKEFGIYLYNSNYNTVVGNNASYNKEFGIYLYDSNYNTISGNSVNNNEEDGISIRFSDNNIIIENTIISNDRGICLDNSDNNCIYLNCFDNILNAVDNGSDNNWDNGFKGNYWADYTGLDADSNGIGDIPYNIIGSAGAQDLFPLMICPRSDIEKSIISGYYPFLLLGILFITLIMINIRVSLKKRKK